MCINISDYVEFMNNSQVKIPRAMESANHSFLSKHLYFFSSILQVIFKSDFQAAAGLIADSRKVNSKTTTNFVSFVAFYLTDCYEIKR